ncbi:PQQ-dependent sugar dehydrogenase [Solwaraspora sp. WMMD1047]|uniref:PQQ-dependent sugar dehydrogenase n=1 Tax=Solwaraspora sp. WMMD1047 TaxID=3016102 RepID=UPI0024173637|nr:PQQ-dependent sugar dehydrogenase [Solwaraspora sp. WMMD1047]MDG4832736.1 PQQ-dependent sugar dehydrogenase [Solwaraspora sp. WMMD1047]
MPGLKRSSRIGLVMAMVAAVLTPIVTTTAPAAAVTLPAGFQEQVVFSGLNLPTNIEFAPDGRIFVAEKAGRVKVYDGLSDPTPTIFADLTANVHSQHDRGLLGLAIHPQFPAQPYLYVLYAYDAPPGETAPYWNDNCSAVGGTNGGRCIVTGRLSKLTAGNTPAGTGTANTMTGTEQVLVQDWCQQWASHATGDLAFGADGMLYATSGDGASYNQVDYGQLGNPPNPCADPPNEGGGLRSQDLRTMTDPTQLNGAVLRLDPTTGAAAAGNPLAASTDVNARRIVADGQRNPFRMTVRPGTSEVWTSDVGWNKWEEINRVVDPTAASPANFGWPCYEGAARQGGYDGANLPICENLYTGAGQTAPYYAYDHAVKVVSGEACPSGSSSVGGLAFSPASGGSYPATYQGALFFSDYSRDCIWAMLPNAPGGLPDPANRQTFASAASNPVDLAIGPGGDLYYVDHGGNVRRIRYFPGNQPPQASIVASPTSGAAPLTVNFDATGSTDPDPADQGQLRYEWDFTNDGTVDSTAATVSHTYPAGGPYTARLRVVDTLGAADTETVPIQTGNSMPTAVIDTPAASLTWAVNDTITFSGHATDPDQGTLPASALHWRMLLHHCYTLDNCHTHALQDFTGVAGGSMFAPDHEYPSYLELVLTATDAQGLSHQSSVRLDPKTVDITFDSSPSGLQLAFGSDTQVTPFTRTVIQGSSNTVSAVTPQTLSGTTYTYASWSDGGAQSHVITAPATPASYVATFTGTPATVLLSRTELTVTGQDSQETAGENGRGINVLDGNTATIWHTQWQAADPPHPHWITLDLGAAHQVNRLYYLPRQNMANGRISSYQVHLSSDGTTWGSPVAGGTFPNSTAEQTVTIAPTTARYVRLTALGEVNGNPWTSVAELNVGVVPTTGQTLAAASTPRKSLGGGSAAGQSPPRIPVRR